MSEQPSTQPQPISFKAETRQLLDILIHSLYTEREIFLRELISNAADALTRLDFELLTNRAVLDAEAPLAIRIIADEKEGTLTVEDNGIGMTAEELTANLGTIAHSGARDFVAALQQSGKKVTDLIGQFGVGFYSAFMVAEWIRVISRSYRPEAQAASWYCTGADTFLVEPAERERRGTAVILKLKEDAREFLQEHRLRQIIRKHSDFIPFPIYLGDSNEQVNRQTAIWRQSPREVDTQAYHSFYQQLTLDPEPPLAHAHMVVDAPVQMYALLYIPADPEKMVFALRRQPGLKLYARKVLIQEYNQELLPEYLDFVQGVVDSEDLPLNVSREAVQAGRVMANLRKLVTSKVLDTLKKLAQEEPEKYGRFWQVYQRFLKRGVALEADAEALIPLLRFHTTTHPEQWSSLEDYVKRMPEGQTEIYYLLADDERSALHSPHLDLVRRYGYEVLLFTDPLDPFMLSRLSEFQGRKVVNVANASLAAPPEAEAAAVAAPDAAQQADLVQRFQQHLGERVAGVRLTDRLADSPARLVDPEGAPNQETQRVLRLLGREFTLPKKILELNPRHPLLRRLAALSAEDPRQGWVIEQIFEDALLIEGLHPDPAGMIGRIQQIMEAALSPAADPLAAPAPAADPTADQAETAQPPA